MREVSAVKCVIDFRVAYYNLVGNNKARVKYISAALDLHKHMTNRKIEAMNRIVRDWVCSLE